jgi:uncharacterized protein with HEPN domain
MPHSVREYLRHILDETHYLVECSQNLDKEKFLQDETLKRAFVRSVEIIGEAVKQIPESTRSHYPQIDWHLRMARFWPDNFHYKSAVERADSIYVMGIVQQVIHNLIQVIVALNETYFPGDKKLDIALDHLLVKPEQFVERVQNLLYPGTNIEQPLFHRQRQELVTLTAEIEALVAV